MPVTAPYIEYYSKHSISPVTREISKKNSFFTQREYLYTSLGVPTALLENSKVIEFGPGNGVNAVFTYSLKPKEYVLVEGNPIAIKNINENLKLHYTSLDCLKITQCLIEEFDHKPEYDLVICENVIPYQHSPADFVRSIAKNAKSGGLLFVTCNDPISNLSETLRSIVGLTITKNISDYEKKAEALVEFFSGHLENLKHLGRDPKSWIQDNVLNVRWVVEANLFSISETIDALSSEFRFHNSSPVFLKDMRWYKSVEDNASLNQINEIAKTNYYRNIINLLDYRDEYQSHSVELGKQIIVLATQVRNLCNTYFQSSTPQALSNLIDGLYALSAVVKQVSEKTAQSIDAYANVLRLEKYELVNVLDDIITWWGRGTQHVSFIKN